MAFYQMNLEFETDYRFADSFIELDEEEFIEKMEVRYFLALNNEFLETFEFEGKTRCYYPGRFFNVDREKYCIVDREEFEKWDIWVHTLHMNQEISKFLGGFTSKELTMSKLKLNEKDFRERVLKEIEGNKQEFEMDFMVIKYNTGSKEEEKYVYGYSHIGLFAYTDKYRNSTLEEELQEELENMKFLVKQEDAGVVYSLYKSNEGDYYFNRDSTWSEEIEAHFDIYKLIKNEDFESILNEYFELTFEDLEDRCSSKI